MATRQTGKQVNDLGAYATRQTKALSWTAKADQPNYGLASARRWRRLLVVDGLAGIVMMGAIVRCVCRP